MTEHEDIIKELEGIKEDFDSMMKNPVNKTLIQYRDVVKLLIRDEKAETEYLTKKEEQLSKLLETGIYEDSRIAQRYSAVLDIYKRLLLTYTKYTEVADESIKKIKMVVKEMYITKMEHDKSVKDKVKYYKGVKKDVKEELEDFDELVKKEKANPWKWKKGRKPNPWIEHLNKVREENPGMPPPEAATLAKETYKKK